METKDLIGKYFLAPDNTENKDVCAYVDESFDNLEEAQKFALSEDLHGRDICRGTKIRKLELRDDIVKDLYYTASEDACGATYGFRLNLDKKQIKVLKEKLEEVFNSIAPMSVNYEIIEKLGDWKLLTGLKSLVREYDLKKVVAAMQRLEQEPDSFLQFSF